MSTRGRISEFYPHEPTELVLGKTVTTEQGDVTPFVVYYAKCPDNVHQPMISDYNDNELFKMVELRQSDLLDSCNFDPSLGKISFAKNTTKFSGVSAAFANVIIEFGGNAVLRFSS